MHADAHTIIARTIQENLPTAAVKQALESHTFTGTVSLLAIGKAAWVMAKAASNFLGEKISKGIVITKYGHAQGAIPRLEILEAGHPISDDNTIAATDKAIKMAEALSETDEVLFLVSGGGSALFESPLPGVTLADLVELNNQLLASGADIVEINTVRKRLSKVKAGRFAELCNPAKVFAVVLSDVLGDRLDSIASGPAAPDYSTVKDALSIVKKYNLKLSPAMMEHLNAETPKKITNVETVITGSVRTLCDSVASAAKELGYEPLILSTTMSGEASDAGTMIASMALETGRSKSSPKKPCAIILGGETVVHLKGNGLGGRNQEMALAAAITLQGMENVVFFSLGSDGSDGPTDAAGGIVDGLTVEKLQAKGMQAQTYLENNDSYHALKAVDALIQTGPTGTNVNDVSVLLCK